MVCRDGGIRWRFNRYKWIHIIYYISCACLPRIGQSPCRGCRQGLFAGLKR